ncbi:hypothetical protein [Allonocardiopsis opalescens]|uniref:Uncharacterized protein n=1 Tax=Allonocardiopsis opalescens TaxID=1144618 RepID=A0A2T0QAE7_9ACTN|nr:hypothetical protein [Allonocardiopsis opalescens]PRY00795.1 hypothetical protein CLV72_102427 [Allonocardiopsis opalescens]
MHPVRIMLERLRASGSDTAEPVGQWAELLAAATGLPAGRLRAMLADSGSAPPPITPALPAAQVVVLLAGYADQARRLAEAEPALAGPGGADAVGRSAEEARAELVQLAVEEAAAPGPGGEPDDSADEPDEREADGDDEGEDDGPPGGGPWARGALSGIVRSRVLPWAVAAVALALAAGQFTTGTLARAEAGSTELPLVETPVGTGGRSVVHIDGTPGGDGGHDLEHTIHILETGLADMQQVIDAELGTALGYTLLQSGPWTDHYCGPGSRDPWRIEMETRALDPRQAAAARGALIAYWHELGFTTVSSYRFEQGENATGSIRSTDDPSEPSFPGDYQWEFSVNSYRTPARIFATSPCVQERQ